MFISRKSIAFFVLLLLSITTFCKANEGFRVLGFVRDSLSFQALPNATIILKNKSTEEVKSTISSKDGFFEIDNLSSDEYFLTIKYVGYKEKQIKINVNNSELNLANILLALDITVLNEVQIKAKVPLVTQEKGNIIYNIKNGIWENIGNAFDLIKQIPNIKFSNLTPATMKGKNVTFFVDGRKLDLTVQNLETTLSTIISSEIDKIELIGNPGSKYESSILSVVNIITLKQQNYGTNGNITGKLGFAKNFRTDNSFQITNKSEKLLLSGGMGYYKSKILLLSKNTRSIIPEHRFEDKSNDLQRLGIFDTRLGVEFNIFKSFKVNSNFKFETGNSNRDIDYTSFYNLANLAKNLTFFQNDKEEATKYFSSINIEKKNKKDSSSFIFDLDLNNYVFDFQERAEVKEKDADKSINYTILTPAYRNIYLKSFSLKYNKPFKRNGFMEYGYQINSNESITKSKYIDNGITDKNKTSDYFYSETINSFYFNLDYKIKLFSFQTGLRYENSKLIGIERFFDTNSITYKYNNLYPFVNSQYKISDISEISIAFSKKVIRPIFDYYSKRYFFKSPYFFKRGGGIIQPSFMYNYDMSYKVNDSWSFNISYTNQKGRFFETPIKSETNLVIYQIGSLDFLKYTDFNITYSKDITPSWYISAYIDGYHSQLVSREYNLDKKGNTVSISLQNSISIKDKLKIGLTSSFTSTDFTNGYNTLPQYSTNLNVSKFFLKKKLNVNLIFRDIFNTLITRIDYKDINLHIKDEYKTETRLFRINLTYKFGNKNVEYQEKASVIDKDINRAQ